MDELMLKANAPPAAATSKERMKKRSRVPEPVEGENDEDTSGDYDGTDWSYFDNEYDEDRATIDEGEDDDEKESRHKPETGDPFGEALEGRKERRMIATPAEVGHFLARTKLKEENRAEEWRSVKFPRALVKHWAGMNPEFASK